MPTFSRDKSLRKTTTEESEGGTVVKVLLQLPSGWPNEAIAMATNVSGAPEVALVALPAMCRTLTVGDGDLSFSRALASQRAVVEGAELVATVYDGRKELLGALELMGSFCSGSPL
eukprot:s3413_g2.t1